MKETEYLKKLVFLQNAYNFDKLNFHFVKDLCVCHYKLNNMKEYNRLIYELTKINPIQSIRVRKACTPKQLVVSKPTIQITVPPINHERINGKLEILLQQIV